MASTTIGGIIVAKYIEYVAKEDVIELFRSYGHTGKDIPFHVLDDSIFEMKAADVAPIRHGHWIIGGDNDDFDVKCSKCEWTDTFEVAGIAAVERIAKAMHYCLNCGARMDGVVKR